MNKISSRTIIYLVRHGKVENPKQIIYTLEIDLPLSQAGHLQMRKLAKRLKNQGICPQIIYISPLLRTVQTAQEMVSVFGNVPIIKKKELLEVGSRGLAGKPISWARERDVYHWPDRDYWIEAPEKISQRMTTVLEVIRKKHQGQTVIVISHGDPLAFAFWRLLHPKGLLPSILELREKAYLDKGEAWRVVFDSKGKIVKHELISKPDTLEV